MTNTKQTYKSDAYASIHSSAKALHKVAALSKTTLRDFDAACVTTPALIKPKQIKKLREQHHMSQPIFARYLNTSESTIQKWETGAKQPSGLALRLLSVVQKHGIEVLA
jgi:putative transcriptional regulator